MTTVNSNIPVSAFPDDAPELAPPEWVHEWAGVGSTRKVQVEHMELRVAEGSQATLLSVCYRDAVHAPPGVLEAETIAIYRLIRNRLAASRHPWPVRLWNYLPQIHQRMDETRDRYMVFNGGRFKEYCQWWGGPGKFPENVPTASGIGHTGDDLIVHCLGSSRPGMAIENPRQIPAFGYSKRYGPLPPCFARATLLHGQDEPVLLVGGTASIVGEQSMHMGMLEAQTSETLKNLAAVVQAAARRIGQAAPDERSALAAFTSLRAYCPIVSDCHRIKGVLREQFAGIRQMELVQAALCRSELMIEIEGVAKLCFT